MSVLGPAGHLSAVLVVDRGDMGAGSLTGSVKEKARFLLKKCRVFRRKQPTRVCRFLRQEVWLDWVGVIEQEVCRFFGPLGGSFVTPVWVTLGVCSSWRPGSLGCRGGLSGGGLALSRVRVSSRHPRACVWAWVGWFRCFWPFCGVEGH